MENSVVKIFSTTERPDLAKPWAKQSPRELSGSGMVIEGRRILTNAHVVAYATEVQVQANQSGEKRPAVVESFAPGIDLAVLRLEDDTFFETHPALPRAHLLSRVKDPVLVYGYPTGGTNLSITKGIVSRIEFTGYHYPTSGLRLQIDAAINPGNSGGPALVGDQVIGLAFRQLSGADNIGYIIPSEEIDLFLEDVADGTYDGKPALYDELQTMENPALREFLKLDKTVHGVAVREPYDQDPSYPLRRWDVITRIGDTPVDDQSMVTLADHLRVRFLYLVQKSTNAGKVALTVMRDGQELAVEVPVAQTRPKLIPYLDASYPPYFIYGPVVFSVATENLVAAVTSSPSAAPGRNANQGAMMTTLLSQRNSPLLSRRGDRPSFPGEELVVISSPFFPHKLSRGYANAALRVVESINHTRVRNLRHVVELLRDSTEPFTVIEFAGLGQETIVFPHRECAAATDAILTRAGVRAQASADLLAVWQATTTP